MPTSYDEVLYPSAPFAQTHPDRLATLGALFGVPAAPPDACRVLELGCGNGGNLIPMAYNLPRSSFLGVDLAECPIRAGTERIGRLGLRNITLRAMDLMAIPGDFGEFDYIIAHGLYSWVPPAVQNKILAVLQAHLAPNGIAYVSYNAMPGGHVRSILRDMLLYVSQGLDTPAERVEAATGYLRFVAAPFQGDSDYHRLLRGEAERILNRKKEALFHDELSDCYEPVYFHAFIDEAAEYGLRYLAEAAFHDMQPERLPPEVLAGFEQLAAGNRIVREQFMDFWRCRRFRQTLLCRSGVPVPDEPVPDAVENLFASCAAEPAGGAPDLSAGVPVEFRTLQDTAMRTANPVAKAVIRYLGGRWPEAVHFHEVVQETHCDAQPVRDVLLACYKASLAELHVRPPACVRRPGLCPQTTALARLQAESTDECTTQRHATWHIADENERELILLLDGTRAWQNLRKWLKCGDPDAELARLGRGAMLVA